MSQKNQVLDHLKSGQSINQPIAIALYRIWRLSSVIFRLRGEGHPIETQEIAGENYVSYYLPR